VAAHYGLVSVVTFLAATEAVKRTGMPYGYLPALVAVLEVPDHRRTAVRQRRGKNSGGGWKKKRFP
jgi:hypothetical protein